MINFDDHVNENKTEHNKNWPCIPDKPQRILIIGDSVTGKTNVLLNLIENQPDNENKTKHNKNWPYIPDHPDRILIIGGSGSGKTNLFLNLM